MSKRDQYQIVFQKSILPSGDTYYYAMTNNITNGAIAFHLRYSNLVQTQGQIKDINTIINDYQSGLPFDEFWGEIDGSQLFVYPANNTVEIENTAMPIADFLELLQEWQSFISNW